MSNNSLQVPVPRIAGVEILAVSPTAAAHLMGIGRTFIYKLFSNGSLRSVKVGNRRLVTLEAMRECLSAHETKP